MHSDYFHINNELSAVKARVTRVVVWHRPHILGIKSVFELPCSSKRKGLLHGVNNNDRLRSRNVTL